MDILTPNPASPGISDESAELGIQFSDPVNSTKLRCLDGPELSTTVGTPNVNLSDQNSTSEQSRAKSPPTVRQLTPLRYLTTKHEKPLV